MEDLTNITDEELRRVIQMVRTIDDVDLGQFQPIILRHRVCRFAALQGYESVSKLVEKLITDRSLIHIFLQKLTVPTTEMIRDAEFWTELEAIINDKLSAERFIKIWVPDICGDDELNTLLVILSRNNLMHKATIYATSQFQQVIDSSHESYIDTKKFEISEANFKRINNDNTHCVLHDRTGNHSRNNREKNRHAVNPRIFGRCMGGKRGKSRPNYTGCIRCDDHSSETILSPVRAAGRL